MLVLELFSGTGSVGKNAKKRGYKVISVDSDIDSKADIKVDILDWDYKSLNLKPDFIWASPPCGSFSNMAMTSNKNSKIRQRSRHTPSMKKLKPYSTAYTYYCLYADNRKKPTDFFNNFDLDLKKGKCRALVSVQQVRTGTMGGVRDEAAARLGKVGIPLCERYKIPQKLLDDIFTQMKNKKIT